MSFRANYPRRSWLYNCPKCGNATKNKPEVCPICRVNIKEIQVGDKDAKGIPPTQYTPTINTVGNGTTTGAGTYDKGTIVPATATPAPG